MDRKFKVRLQKIARLALPLGYCGDTLRPLIRACNTVAPSVLLLTQLYAHNMLLDMLVVEVLRLSEIVIPAVMSSTPYTVW